MTFKVRILKVEKTKKPSKIAAFKPVASTIMQKISQCKAVALPWVQKVPTVSVPKKKIAFIAAAGLVALVVCLIILKILISLRLISFGGFASAIGTPPPIDKNGYTNILLLGQGDLNHEGVDLTDTLIVASIDTKTSSVAMISIPRDTLTTTEFFGEKRIENGRRINSIYRDIKGKYKSDGKSTAEASKFALLQIQKEIGTMIGLDIHYSIKIDFSGFIKIVDELGGVHIDVPYDIVDTAYPDENYGYQTFRLNAGPSILNGQTALKYARSRHSTNDFSRSSRQQQIISALAAQAKDAGLLSKPSTLLHLYTIISEHLETTMNSSELIGLASVGKNINKQNVLTVQLNSNNGLYNVGIEPGGFLYTPPRDQFGGAAVLLPVSIPEFPITWNQIQHFISLYINNRNVYMQKPTIAIINAGAISGSARKLGDELLRYGFNVELTANAEEKYTQPTSEILTVINENSSQNNENKDGIELISTLLSLPISKTNTTISADQKRTITIVLGEDYTYTPLISLLPKQ